MKSIFKFTSWSLFGKACIVGTNQGVTVLINIFNGVVVNMVYEYMLSESELDTIIEKFDNLKPKEFKMLFKSVQSSDNQEKVIEDFVRKYFEEIIRRRPKIEEPTPNDLIDTIIAIEQLTVSEV